MEAFPLRQHPAPMMDPRLVGAISAGVFLAMVFSVALGLAFFTVVPPFVDDAAAALDPAAVDGGQINSSTITILRLIPFVLGAMLLAAPLVVLVVELKRAG